VIKAVITDINGRNQKFFPKKYGNLAGDGPNGENERLALISSLCDGRLYRQNSK
jgi:hypothetical protein